MVTKFLRPRNSPSLYKPRIKPNIKNNKTTTDKFTNDINLDASKFLINKPKPTNQQINRAENKGFFTVPSTGEIDFTKATKQLIPARKTVLNNAETMKTYRDAGIGRILANKENPNLNIPKIGPLTEYQSDIYRNSIHGAHPLKKLSRAELSDDMKLYTENPSFLTTGYRNMSTHNHYENRMKSYLDRKSELVDKFKNKEISQGQFLMEKAGLDSSIKNTTRDMRKLGLESMMFDKANNKFRYYGGLYDNMAQLYKNMGDDYFLQNPSALTPGTINSKAYKKLLGYNRPSTKEGKNIKGELVQKDADDAMKIGEGQWWSKKIKNKEGNMENRGRNNFGDYWRTRVPFMKNRGSNQNLNAGGLISMLSRDELQGMAKSLSPKQVKMLTRQGPR